MLATDKDYAASVVDERMSIIDGMTLRVETRLELQLSTENKKIPKNVQTRNEFFCVTTRRKVVLNDVSVPPVGLTFKGQAVQEESRG
jgi:hypothetical protein